MAEQGILKKPSLRRLTIKQRKFVKAYIQLDGNGTRAAMEVYDTEDYDTANSIARENLQKPPIKDAIERALERQEITIDSAIEPIKNGLIATKQIYKSNMKTGELEALGDAPDHNVRLKSSAMALKLLGADADENPGGNTFHLNFGTQNFIKTDRQQ